MRGKKTETEEQLDRKMALHFYSRMAFIEKLLPKLQASDDARVLRSVSFLFLERMPHFLKKNLVF